MTRGKKQHPTNPVCEECNEAMSPFHTQEGEYMVSGWGCDLCGWSYDTSRDKIHHDGHESI